jgi:hypothetical protein
MGNNDSKAIAQFKEFDVKNTGTLSLDEIVKAQDDSWLKTVSLTALYYVRPNICSAICHEAYLLKLPMRANFIFNSCFPLVHPK